MHEHVVRCRRRHGVDGAPRVAQVVQLLLHILRHHECHAGTAAASAAAQCLGHHGGHRARQHGPHQGRPRARQQRHRALQPLQPHLRRPEQRAPAVPPLVALSLPPRSAHHASNPAACHDEGEAVTLSRCCRVARSLIRSFARLPRHAHCSLSRSSLTRWPSRGRSSFASMAPLQTTQLLALVSWHRLRWPARASRRRRCWRATRSCWRPRSGTRSPRSSASTC